jgi:sialate O-acetylesterase
MLWFDHAQCLKSVDGNPLKGFMIAGADEKYMEAKAIITEGTILLNNPVIVKPMHVKYAFKDTPVVNLVNNTGLPAIPFRINIKDTL